MKRTILILCVTLSIIVIACSLGIHASGQTETLAESARSFIDACRAQDSILAQEILAEIRETLRHSRWLFHILLRMDTNLAIERSIEEMELSLLAPAFEDGISCGRELLRLCEEASHIGRIALADIL